MIIGHTLQQKTLQRLIATDGLSHGYIFFGMPNVGKRTTATALARFLETETWSKEEDAPLQDLLYISPRGNSIGVEQAREIMQFLWKKPFKSSRRTVIVDDAHALTREAQNALLKVTEEPPESALVIFIVRDPEMLWSTLSSRLQYIYFPPVSQKEISDWLVSEQDVSRKQAVRFAKYAFGRPGLAWRYAHDEALMERKKELEAFISAGGKQLTATVKNIVESDDFSLSDFLDGLSLRFANREEKRAEPWHAVLQLRQQAERFNVNPRIQLLALHKKITKS